MRNPSGALEAAAAASTSKTPCCSKVGLKRGPWTPEEDELLANYIRKDGEGRWRTLPKRAGLLRCGKSCRLRWMNYLRPSVKRGQIAPDEEDLILRLHRLLGNRWSMIAGRIPGRTDNEIKNYWNTHLSKKLISQGIDPRTHKPLTANNPSEDVPAHASKPNNNPNPNPNPNSSGLEETSGDKGNGCFNGTNLDQNFSTGVVGDGNENFQNSDGMMIGLQSSDGNSNEEDNLDYCSDDLFSSFLNSLINEDMFPNQHLHLPHHVIAPPILDPLIPSAQTFGTYGTIWEAALTSSAAALNDNKHKWFVDHVNKHS